MAVMRTSEAWTTLVPLRAGFSTLCDSICKFVKVMSL